MKMMCLLNDQLTFNIDILKVMGITIHFPIVILGHYMFTLLKVRRQLILVLPIIFVTMLLSFVH